MKNDVLHFENEVARSRLTVSSSRQVTGVLPFLANPREQEDRQVERYHSAAEVALLCKKFEASDFESFDAYYDSLTNTNEDMHPGRYHPCRYLMRRALSACSPRLESESL